MSKLTEKQISGMLKESTIQKSYNKWSEEIQSNMEEVEKIFIQNSKNMELKRREKTDNTISKYRKCI